ncbi:MAG: CopG family transcriptional regulator [Actinomycetia bacterium]|nr:CopG family transcriptional regulator [Actinomycetes bacterium]
MKRTQIYLTDKENRSLKAISSLYGKSKSEIIREAIDNHIEQIHTGNKMGIINSAAGMWKNRNDLPDFQEARKDWDR